MFSRVSLWGGVGRVGNGLPRGLACVGPRGARRAVGRADSALGRARDESGCGERPGARREGGGVSEGKRARDPWCVGKR